MNWFEKSEAEELLAIGIRWFGITAVGLAVLVGAMAADHFGWIVL